jgi:hypothetical protein
MTASRGDRISGHDARPAAGNSINQTAEDRARGEQLVAEMEAKRAAHDLRVKDLFDRRAWKEATGPDDPLLLLFVRPHLLEEAAYAWLRGELVEQAARVELARGAGSGSWRWRAGYLRDAPGVPAGVFDEMFTLFDEVAAKMDELSQPEAP